MRRPNRLERLPQQYFVNLLARISAAAADGGPPVLDLGRGNPRPARRRTWSKRCAPRCSSPASTATRRSADCPEPRGDCCALSRRLRRHARSGDRGRGRPGHEGGARRARARALRRGRHAAPSPIRTTPTTPRARRSPARAIETVPLQPELGWAPALDDGAGRLRPLSQLPVQPVRGLRAGGCLRRRDRLGASNRRRSRARRGLHRHRLRRTRDRRASSRRRRQGRRRRDVVDVEDVRHGRLADRLRRRQRRDRRAHQPLQRPHPCRASSLPSSTPRSPRSKGRRTRSPNGWRRTSGDAT